MSQVSFLGSFEREVTQSSRLATAYVPTAFAPEATKILA
jgi:hypothetical protein